MKESFNFLDLTCLSEICFLEVFLVSHCLARIRHIPINRRNVQFYLKKE